MHRVVVTADGVELFADSESSFARTTTDVRTRMRSEDRVDMSRVAAAMGRELQEAIDVRILIADLPDDDPDKTTDPAQPDIFWEAGFLVSRSEIVTVAWDDGFVPTIRKV